MTTTNRILCLISLALIGACSKKDSNNNTNTNPPVNQQQNPTKATAVLPVNGDFCTDYSEIPGDSENIKVVFKWSSAQNTNSYRLQVFDSTTEVHSETSTNLETDVTLLRGKAYSWQITTINTDAETTSDTFSFTTPGEAITNYVPYAAEIEMTFDKSASTLTVSWVGDDEDNDTIVYDITIKEGNVELVNEIDLTTNEYGPIDAIADMVYTVEVISKDPTGNISISTKSRLMD